MEKGSTHEQRISQADHPKSKRMYESPFFFNAAVMEISRIVDPRMDKIDGMSGSKVIIVSSNLERVGNEDPALSSRLRIMVMQVSVRQSDIQEY